MNVHRNESPPTLFPHGNHQMLHAFIFQERFFIIRIKIEDVFDDTFINNNSVY